MCNGNIDDKYKCKYTSPSPANSWKLPSAFSSDDAILVAFIANNMDADQTAPYEAV